MILGLLVISSPLIYFCITAPEQSPHIALENYFFIWMLAIVSMLMEATPIFILWITGIILSIHTYYLLFNEKWKKLPANKRIAFTISNTLTYTLPPLLYVLGIIPDILP